VDVAVLVPVKAFTEAKQRLSAVLTPADRIRLAMSMAEGVVRASAPHRVFVVCDDAGVRDWAEALGATALWTAELGLNGAVDDGVTAVSRAGFEHVIVTHADLPLPVNLPEVARRDTITLVPDRRRDGTNVMSFPTSAPIPASYGANSFERHLEHASTHAPRTVEIRIDAELSIDIDTPSDLTHPILRKVLPTWLPTIQANRFTQRDR
jgi:2-phospho-L-lactate guanylyltransferase